jgi:hypothetical protein
MSILSQAVKDAASPANKFDFATSMIRASPLQRLTDRSFVLTVLTACYAAYLHQTKTIDGQQFMSLLQWTVGPWIAAEKFKDAYLGGSAIKSSGGPDTINAGGDVTVQPEGEAAPQSAPVALAQSTLVDDFFADSDEAPNLMQDDPRPIRPDSEGGEL